MVCNAAQADRHVDAQQLNTIRHYFQEHCPNQTLPVIIAVASVICTARCITKLKATGGNGEIRHYKRGSLFLKFERGRIRSGNWLPVIDKTGSSSNCFCKIICRSYLLLWNGGSILKNKDTHRISFCSMISVDSINRSFYVL